ncbi:MAG: BTAD domain-containing putative transcriptional regulator [Sporichthyaceae bacterium]
MAQERVTAEVAPPQVCLLGPVELRANGEQVPLTAARQRAVLALLALQAGRVVSVDALIEGLWGSAVPAGATTTLKSLTSRLRRTLRQGFGDAVTLTFRPPGYLLELDADAVDALRFARLLTLAQSLPDPADRSAVLIEALGLWRGAPFTDLADLPFAQSQATRLGELRLGAVEDLAAAELALGRAPQAVGRLQAHVAAHPFRERAWGQLMVGLYQAGRQGDALRAFRDARRILVEELGVEPGPALRAIQEQVLGQRVDAGPPATGAGLYPALPRPLSGFVGRDTERAQLAALLRTDRMVTLVGAGGAGKTRLALEVARESAGSFPDGVCFVDLASVDSPALVARQVAAALGLAARERGPDPRVLTDQLAELLNTRHLLLILDNCEHLTSAVVAVLEPLLRGARSVVVLATSRERLHLTGETVWRVPPLSLPAAGADDPARLHGSDAVDLFCARAAALDPGFAPTPGNAAALTRICRRLDGIPLALELAAPHLAILGPAELARRLDDRLALLTGGGVGTPARHRTLRACLDWGHDLLAEPERGLLAQLSVFVDGFALDAAEAVCAQDDVDVLATLTRLVETCWVGVESGASGVRCRLTETVREYARERLAAHPADERASEVAHGDYFLAVAQTYRGAPLCAPRAWMSTLAADYENVRAALGRCAARGDGEAALRLAARLFAYWALDGRFAEGRTRLERLLATGPATPGADRAWALIGLGLMVGQLGDLEQGQAHFRAAARCAEDCGDGGCAAYATGYLGGFAMQRGDTETGERLLHAAMDTLTAAGDELGGAWCEFNLGFAHLARGHQGAAAEALGRALAVGRRSGSEVLIAHAAGALATVVALAGDAQRATALAAESVATAGRLGLRHVAVMALLRSTETAVLLGEHADAGDRLGEALALIAELGGGMWINDGLQLTGVVLAHRGDAAAGLRLLAAGGGAAAPAAQGGHRPIQGAVDATRIALASTLDPEEFARQARFGAALSTQEALAEAIAAMACPT